MTPSPDVQGSPASQIVISKNDCMDAGGRKRLEQVVERSD
jgi:hypothetical protein